MTAHDHPAGIPWNIPVAVANVPEGGLHIEASADAAARAAIARLAGVDALPRLDAVFDVARWGKGGLHVTGSVSGTVQQTCVVTLEPLENEIRESVDILFTPPRAPGGSDVPADPAFEAAARVAAGTADEAELVVSPDEVDPPEELVDGAADLGRVATEFLVLAVDPYPRKAGAVFDAPAPPAAEPAESPFAALAALKEKGGKDKA